MQTQPSKHLFMHSFNHFFIHYIHSCIHSYYSFIHFITFCPFSLYFAALSSLLAWQSVFSRKLPVLTVLTKQFFKKFKRVQGILLRRGKNFLVRSSCPHLLNLSAMYFGFLLIYDFIIHIHNIVQIFGNYLGLSQLHYGYNSDFCG